MGKVVLQMGRKGVKRKGRWCGKGGGLRMRWRWGVGQGGRVLVWVGVCYAKHIQQNRNARNRGNVPCFEYIQDLLEDGVSWLEIFG